MTQFVEVPPKRLADEVLRALLEEYASRDGTDYGERELTMDDKVANLQAQLRRGDLLILYDANSEHWDLLPREHAAALLDD